MLKIERFLFDFWWNLQETNKQDLFCYDKKSKFSISFEQNWLAKVGKNLNGMKGNLFKILKKDTYNQISISFIAVCILVLQLGFFFANSTYRNTWNAYLVAQNVGSDTDFCVPKLDPSSDKIFWWAKFPPRKRRAEAVYQHSRRNVYIGIWGLVSTSFLRSINPIHIRGGGLGYISQLGLSPPNFLIFRWLCIPATGNNGISSHPAKFWEKVH